MFEIVVVIGFQNIFYLKKILKKYYFNFLKFIFNINISKIYKKII
jgi:hypothetical protein